MEEIDKKFLKELDDALKTDDEGLEFVDPFETDTVYPVEGDIDMDVENPFEPDDIDEEIKNLFKRQTKPTKSICHIENCRQLLNSDLEAMSHFKTKHKDSKPFKCQKCEKIFMRRESCNNCMSKHVDSGLNKRKSRKKRSLKKSKKSRKKSRQRSRRRSSRRRSSRK